MSVTQIPSIPASANDRDLVAIRAERDRLIGLNAQLRAGIDSILKRISALEAIQDQYDELAAGARLLLEQYDASGDFRMGGKLTNRPFLMLKDALAKVRTP